MATEAVAMRLLIAPAARHALHTQCAELGVIEHKTLISSLSQGTGTVERINDWLLRCGDGSHQSSELIDLSCDLCRGCDASRD